MIVIKNRVNGEYDTKTLYARMNSVDRSSWQKLAHAKNHVIQKITSYRNKLSWVDWYLDADYIDVDTGEVYPVIDHLRDYFSESFNNRRLTEEQVARLRGKA